MACSHKSLITDSMEWGSITLSNDSVSGHLNSDDFGASNGIRLPGSCRRFWQVLRRSRILKKGTLGFSRLLWTLPKVLWGQPFLLGPECCFHGFVCTAVRSHACLSLLSVAEGVTGICSRIMHIPVQYFEYSSNCQLLVIIFLMGLILQLAYRLSRVH